MNQLNPYNGLLVRWGGFGPDTFSDNLYFGAAQIIFFFIASRQCYEAWKTSCGKDVIIICCKAYSPAGYHAPCARQGSIDLYLLQRLLTPKKISNCQHTLVGGGLTIWWDIQFHNMLHGLQVPLQLKLLASKLKGDNSEHNQPHVKLRVQQLCCIYYS